ncbi:MAG: hypothetical protein AAFQ64_14800 [Pseudomonadota bacterium]
MLTLVRPKQSFAAACLALVVSGVGAPASAMTVSYLLTINDPIFNPRNGNFNVPDFQLTNTSDPGVSITDFQLSIGDTTFNYDFVRNESVVSDPNNDFVFTLNTVGRVNNGSGDDILSYSFLGFDPGDSFRFEVDIDADGAGVVEDVRDVVFPAGSAFVTFSNGNTRGNTFNSVDPSGTSFQFVQNLPTTLAPVPVPATFPLLLGALAFGGFAMRRRATPMLG